MTLYIGNDSRLIEFLCNSFDCLYLADALKSYIIDIWPLIKDANVVGSDGKEKDRYVYIPKNDKVYSLRKYQAAQLCALIHSHPENLRNLLAKMPEYVTKALQLILLHGAAGETMLSESGIFNEVVAPDKGNYSYWTSDYCKGKYLSFLHVSNDRGHEDYSENYFILPAFLSAVYAEVLLPGLTEDSIYVDDVPVGNRRYSAESEFLISFPVISAAFFQGKANVKDYKVTVSSANSILKGRYTDKIIPPEFKVSIGQYFLPVLYKFMTKNKNLSPEGCAKGASQYFRSIFSNTFLPAMLPHVKGFKSSLLSGLKVNQWGSLLSQQLIVKPDKWIDIEKFRDYLFVNWSFTGGCPFRPGAFFGMPLVNKFTGDGIFLDTQREEIDLELIKAIVVGMYGMGMVELSVSDDVECDTPCQRVTHVRLTELGKYALGITARYEMKSDIGSKEQFRLDTDYLMITISGADSSLGNLLSEIAVNIGGGRYRIDSGSFLRTCEKPGDVDKKIRYFKHFICAEPPQIWIDFFKDLKRRCAPFKETDASYLMMTIDGQDKELVRLLTSDAEIRSVIVLVEGYRLLVKMQDLNRFTTLMKSHGYLI